MVTSAGNISFINFINIIVEKLQLLLRFCSTDFCPYLIDFNAD